MSWLGHTHGDWFGDDWFSPWATVSLPISKNGVVPCWIATHDKNGIVPVIYVSVDNPNGFMPIRLLPEGPGIVPIKVVTQSANGLVPVVEFQ